MVIPGIIISILTFPGVIVHEFAHHVFCKLFGVRVRKVCYFRFGNPTGYVVHEKAGKFHQTFFITTGPFIMNTLLAILVFLSARTSDSLFLNWLGISIAMHAFPSRGDAKNLWNESKRHLKNNIIAILGFPFSILIWLSNVLSVIWFDLIYSLILFYLVMGL